MFGFNPPQLNVGAEYAALAGQNLATGIQQGASSISDAIQRMTDLKSKAGQTDAAASAAQKMGIFNSDQDPDGTQALQMIQNTPYQYKANIMPSLLQMVGTKATIAWHAAQNQTRQDAADNKGNKNLIQAY